MTIRNAIASLAVSNMDVARAWYSGLFEHGPDSTPMPELMEWSFPGGGWLQVYRAPERAGRGSCTLSVSSIEEIVERLKTLGFRIGHRVDAPKVRTLMLRDPDGNSIAFAETSDPTMAH